MEENQRKILLYSTIAFTLLFNVLLFLNLIDFRFSILNIFLILLIYYLFKKHEDTYLSLEELRKKSIEALSIHLFGDKETLEKSGKLIGIVSHKLVGTYKPDSNKIIPTYSFLIKHYDVEDSDTPVYHLVQISADGKIITAISRVSGPYFESYNIMPKEITLEPTPYIPRIPKVIKKAKEKIVPLEGEITKGKAKRKIEEEIEIRE